MEAYDSALVPPMEYDRLVREAWRLTWRARALWVLGLFAGGSAAPSCSYGQSGVRTPSTGDTPLPGGEAERFFDEAARWAVANAGLLVTLGILIVVLVFVGFAVSLVAQGGMARASADLAAGSSPTLGDAWRAGLRSFWRYLGLWLTLIGVGLAVAVVAVVCFLIVAGVASSIGGPARILVILFGLALAGIGIAAGVVLSTVVAFAQRAIAVEDLGPLDALGAGWRLFRAHVRTSLVVWVIALVLGIASGIVIGIAAAVVAVPLVAVGAVLWFTLGLTAVFLAYVAVAAIVVLAAVLVVAAIVNTFFWHYWTLAYLGLGGRPAAVPA